ncbi:MAG TPA: DUF1064 domain-containing protein [Terriglobales bacterium]
MATSKYRNVKTVVDGVTFDSKREAQRWAQLQLWVRAGGITDLNRQVPFILAPSVVIDGRKRPALRYIADFTYVDSISRQMVIEDVKGRITEGYRIKRHLMAAKGYTITEVK